MLATHAMEAHQDRTILVHTNWQGFTKTDPLTVKMIGWKHKGRKLIVSTDHISLPALEKMATNFDRLNRRLFVINTFIHTLFWPNKAQDKQQ